MFHYALAAVSGALYFLGFAGFGLWPLAFVALIPILWALDPEHTNEPVSFRKLLAMGFIFGLVVNLGGYYWLVETLQRFSGFPIWICFGIALILFAYQGGVLVVFSWLFRRARELGVGNVLAATIAMCAAEWVYPRLFTHYFGNSLHDLPYTIQIADIGGPLLVTALLTAANAGLYVLSLSLRNNHISRKEPLFVLGAWLLTLGYGAYRIHEVDTRAASAKKLSVGIVQADMGLFEKRNDPVEGLRRHVQQSKELEREKKPDLIIWPESAFAWYMPEGVKNLNEVMPRNALLKTPLLFGGLAKREHKGRRRSFNTAFLADANGDLLATYDKTYLLTFSEYIPFAEDYPVLYEWSPNSGQFVPGSHVRPLAIGDAKIGTLICYEDILSDFVRRVMREGEPNVLINLTNDAWFGDTHEPWEHLALAKFRTVEHHRALVRSTNSGVSAVIDPVGRLVSASGVFTRENLYAEVPLLEGKTVYAMVGDFPGMLAFVFAVVIVFRARRKRAGAGVSHGKA